MSDHQLLRSMLAKHSALQLNIDAAQRELDRRNAEGEDVGAYRVCQDTGRIIKCAKAEAIANADAHLSNVGMPTYSELVETLRRHQNVLAGIAAGDLKTVSKNSPALLAGRSILSRIPS